MPQATPMMEVVQRDDEVDRPVKYGPCLIITAAHKKPIPVIIADIPLIACAVFKTAY